MARARAAESPRSRSKTQLIDEITKGIEKFHDILAAVEDFSREGFPYQDGARAKAELQVRENIRKAFGDRSPEYQAHKSYKLRVGSPQETTQSIAVIKSLMAALDHKKLELQGLVPPTPAAEPATPPADRPQMTLVPPTTPAAVQTQPVVMSVVMTTNLSQPSTVTPQPITPPAQPQTTEPSAQALPPPVVPAAHVVSSQIRAVPQMPAPAPQPTSAVVEYPADVQQEVAAPPPVVPAAHVASTQLRAMPPAPMTQPLAAATPQEPPAVTPQPMPAASVAPPVAEAPPPPVAVPPVVSPAPAPEPRVHTEPVPVVAQTASAPPPAEPTPAPAPSIAASTDSIPAFVIPKHSDVIDALRKVCTRFHSVARQLRLRKDYRATLEVEDDYDLQDLLCALLKLEFEEVGSDEWTPPYTGGAPRTTFLLHKDRIAVIAKKTRSGLTTKELAEQIAADTAHCSAREQCSHLFCFIYDPEGRIGSPKRLETDLTSVSDRYTVDVIVAPK